MYLEKLLDTVLRDTLDGQAPDTEAITMGPTLSADQLASVTSGNGYPTPEFPAPVTCLIGIIDNHFNMKEPKMMRLHNFQKLVMEGQSEREKWYPAWSRIFKAYQTSGISSMTEEERLKAYLISITRNKDLKQKLLVQKDSKSLQDLIDIGKNWQNATTLAPKFETPQVASAARMSSYKRERSNTLTGRTPGSKDHCNWCGKTGHGKNPSHEVRKERCPAFGRKCHKCPFTGH